MSTPLIRSLLAGFSGRGVLIVVLFLAYFVITEPTQHAIWTNGVANHVAWTKGLFDGINAVDVEMSRLSQDGLIFVAQDGTSPLILSLLLHTLKTSQRSLL